MEVSKEKICSILSLLPLKLEREQQKLVNSCNLTDYRALVRDEDIWTAAFQKAVDEHEIIHIPAGEYIIDDTIIIPSNRCIMADENAVIKKAKGMNVLMLRNSLTRDGSHLPIIDRKNNQNISIIGGAWCESEEEKGIRDGLYDRNGSFLGVSAGMFFDHVENLCIKNVKISRIGGFGIQVSHVSNACFENIVFDATRADGLHMNGFSENIIAKDIRGTVGDDLIALNAYDWPNSSVAFGPIRNILCEDLEVFEESEYKAFRILPGKYFYEDDTVGDCSIHNVVIRNVKGINTYKFYFQTPRYQLGDAPVSGEPGNCGNIYFENIEISSVEPVDKLPEYMESHPIKGSIAGFELGADIDEISFENIHVTLNLEKYPMSFFMCIGPKSVRIGDSEVFDPYISSRAKRLILKDIIVNGQKMDEKTIWEVIHEIVFDDIYQEGAPKTFGTIEELEIVS